MKEYEVIISYSHRHEKSKKGRFNTTKVAEHKHELLAWANGKRDELFPKTNYKAHVQVVCLGWWGRSRPAKLENLC